MKNIIKSLFVVALSAFALSACEETNYKYYDTNVKTGIYFNSEDSIAFTFTKYAGLEAVEVKIPVEITGYASEEDRYFTVKADVSVSDAVAGTHYESLASSYKVGAGNYQDTVLVTLLNKDIELEDRVFKLKLDIDTGDDFIVGVYDQMSVTLHISNILTEPEAWSSRYYTYFGEYSKVKHELILQVLGLSEIPDVFDGMTYMWTSYGIEMNNYFIENTTYDENGKEIIRWF